MGKKKDYELIHLDDDFIVVNKAADLLAIPDRYMHDLKNLRDLLKREYGDVFVVHRIDKGTSGIMVFARNEAAHKHLNVQFENRTVEKSYLAIVNGAVKKSSGSIEILIAKDESKKGRMRAVSVRGKSALSHYKVEEQFFNFAKVNVRIETGRTHQVRVHMAYLGHALVGDELYGGQPELTINDLKRRIAGNSERPLISRPALHAQSISFKNLDNSTMTFKCDPPKDIRATINQLRKWKMLTT